MLGKKVQYFGLTLSPATCLHFTANNPFTLFTSINHNFWPLTWLSSSVSMPDMARYDPFSPTFDHPLLNSSPDYASRNGSFRNRPIGDIGVVNAQMSFRERNKRLRSLDDEKNQLIEVRMLGWTYVHVFDANAACRIYCTSLNPRKVSLINCSLIRAERPGLTERVSCEKWLFTSNWRRSR
jgi:hypothetical protein